MRQPQGIARTIIEQIVMIKVGIIGGAGYTAGELLRIRRDFIIFYR